MYSTYVELRYASCCLPDDTSCLGWQNGILTLRDGFNSARWFQGLSLPCRPRAGLMSLGIVEARPLVTTHVGTNPHEANTMPRAVLDGTPHKAGHQTLLFG